MTDAAGIPGLDVSHYQGVIDWGRVFAAGRRFVFVKATDGLEYVDPTHAHNVAGARAAGLFVGSYHYGRAKLGNPLGQARHFASQLGSMGAGRLPAVLDMEQAGSEGLSPAELRDFAATFLQELDHLTGRRSFLYTGRAFYLENGLSQLHRPLWLARYGPQPHEPWTFWQNTSAGRVPGITGAVDLNIFVGSAAELMQLAGDRRSQANGPRPPAPKPPAPKPPAPKPPAARPPAPRPTAPRPLPVPVLPVAPQAAPVQSEAVTKPLPVIVAPVPTQAAPVACPAPPASPRHAETVPRWWWLRALFTRS